MRSCRWFARTGIGLLTVAALLCGCSSLSSPKPELEPAYTKLTLNFLYAGGDSATNQAIGETVDRFNKAQNRIQVVGTPGSGLATYDELLKTKLAVGEFPDFLDMRDTQTYADAGKIVPLPQEVVGLLNDPALVNDQVYTAPLVVSSPLGIIYNKDLFARLGIDKEPVNWDEFLDICRTIKASGISPLVVGGKDLWHIGFWQSFFMSNELFADNPNWNRDLKAGRVHFTDANVIRAMKDMTELWTRGYVNSSWFSTGDAQVASFLALGKAAMLYEGSWMFNTIKQANPEMHIGFFALRDRNGRLNIVGKPTPQGIALTAKAAADPEKLAAFTEFMKFFYRPDIYAAYLKTSSGIPATKTNVSYDAPEEMQRVLAVYRDPQAVKTTYMHAYTGDNQIPTEFRDWLWKLIEQWLSTGTPSVEEAMKLADDQFSRMTKTGQP
jgi:raffinose/stachyose/melibiose transport system substrate-binding protein